MFTNTHSLLVNYCYYSSHLDRHVSAFPQHLMMVSVLFGTHGHLLLCAGCVKALAQGGAGKNPR